MPSELRIPPAVKAVLDRVAEEERVEPEVKLLQLLEKFMKPDERVKAYLDTAETLLKHAEELGEKGEFKLAFRKVFSAVKLLIQAKALKDGREPPRSDEDFWRYTGEAGLEAQLVWYTGLAALFAAEAGIKDKKHLDTMIDTVTKMLEDVKG